MKKPQLSTNFNVERLSDVMDKTKKLHSLFSQKLALQEKPVNF